jgi:hypothetical protein
MPYEKQNFTNGTVLTADHLNHMEDGIASALNASESGGRLYEHTIELFHMASFDNLEDKEVRFSFTFLSKSSTPIEDVSTAVEKLVQSSTYGAPRILTPYNAEVYDSNDALCSYPVIYVWVWKDYGDGPCISFNYSSSSSGWMTDSSVLITYDKFTITDTVKEVV